MALMKRASLWSVLGAAAVMMAAGACGSNAGGPLDASSVADGSGQSAGLSSPVARPTPSPTPTPTATPSPDDNGGHGNEPGDDNGGHGNEPGDDNGGQDVEFRGAIQSISAPNLTVAGRLVRTDGSTRILDDRNNPISFSSLRAGMTVEVEGHAQSDRSVAAKKVKIED
jgi:hypothetical protein